MSGSKDHHRNDFLGPDLERIRAETFVTQIEFHDELPSTNDRALELAEKRAPLAPLLVLTAAQTAGRGRGSNRWWADGGALTFSLLLQAEAPQLPQRDWPQLSLTAGLAVCEAVEELVEQATLLKWPNDVYLRGRKVCGILVEVPRNQQGLLVVGIGINVNNSSRSAPAELQNTVIALCDVGGRQFALNDALRIVLNRLSQRISLIGKRDDELRDCWRRRCLLTGRAVHVDLGVRQVSGICRGIDDQGALLVHTKHGTERCFAGVVTLSD